jgi:hypothetical protein
MHQDYSYEIAASDLLHLLRCVPSGAAEGGPIRAPVSLGAVERRAEPRFPLSPAVAILGALREHPALLFERRPGFFAFTDFALQEVLAARWMPREHLLLSQIINDPWWHGVIELGAGLSGADAGARVRAMLGVGADSPAVALLAARCAEAARDLPDDVRRTVDLLLSYLLPPLSIFGAERLVEAGEVVAPLLLRALPRYDTAQRAFSALALGRLCYEPAAAALLALSNDAKRVKDDAQWPVAGYEIDLSGDPVAAYALAALFELARVSKVGKSAFRRALKRAPGRAICDLHDALHRAVTGAREEPAPEVRLLLDELQAAHRRWLLSNQPRR